MKKKERKKTLRVAWKKENQATEDFETAAVHFSLLELIERFKHFCQLVRGRKYKKLFSMLHSILFYNMLTLAITLIKP